MHHSARNREQGAGFKEQGAGSSPEARRKGVVWAEVRRQGVVSAGPAEALEEGVSGTRINKAGGWRSSEVDLDRVKEVSRALRLIRWG